jgi:ubiquinone biosynthesis protein
MLDPKLIPTHLIEPAEVPPVVIKEPHRPSRFHLLYLITFFLRFYLGIFWLWVRRKLNRQEHAHRLRLAFERLGGVWMKLGQLLSLRTDVFSREFCLELSRLQARAEGFPPEMARQIIEKELQGPLESFFDNFESHPFAAASIGQVHRAQLRQERVWVAVKVQRPYAAAAAVREMAFIRFLVRFLERLWFMPNLHWEELLWELNQILAEETDYRCEAASISRLRKSLRKHKIYVHKVFHAYSTRRVLVTEYITAVLMSDYIRVIKTDPIRCEKWQQDNNVDPKLVMRRLFDSLWRQLLRDNLFHSDMHPGNIILLRDSQLSLIDFGAVGSMEREYQRKYSLMMQAMANYDYAKAADCLLLISGALPPTDLTETKQKLIRCLRAWELRSFAKGIPYNEKSMSTLVNELVRILFQYECAADWSFLRITRAQETVDQSLMHLDPTANYTKLMRSFFRRSVRRDRKWMQRPEGVREYLFNLLDLVKIPQQLSENSMFQGWILRRQAQSFRGSTSKLALFFSVLCGRGAVLVMIALVYFFLVFLRQHYPSAVPALAERWLGEEIDAFPHLTYLAWVLTLMVVLNLGLTLASLNRRFARKERATQSTTTV